MSNKKVTRSVEFIAYFQLQAVCAHIRGLVINGIQPGPEARRILKSLRDEFVERTTGRPIERIPEISDTTTEVDLLAIAELLVATNTAFLSPEELEERKRIGFFSTDES